jgi:hypothetical protein
MMPEGQSTTLLARNVPRDDWWDDRIEYTINAPLDASLEDVCRMLKATARGAKVSRLLGPRAKRPPGPHRSYSHDVDLYAKWYEWTQVEGRTLVSFVQAIRNGDVTIGDWGKVPPQSVDTIERRLEKARRWLTPVAIYSDQRDAFRESYFGCLPF